MSVANVGSVGGRRVTPPDVCRVATSWTSQVLPSGSAKHERAVVARARGRRPASGPPAPKWKVSLDLDAAADELGARRLDVGDDEVQAVAEPGADVVIPVPMAIEHAEPGGRQLDDPEVVAGAVVDVDG